MRRDVVGGLLALVCGLAVGNASALQQEGVLDPKPGGSAGGDRLAAAGSRQVTFLAGTQRQLRVDPEPPNRSVSAFYLLELPAGLTASDVKVRVLAVMSGLQNEVRLQDKLSAEVIGTADGAKTELRLEVRLDEPLPSGTYGVRVRFSLPGGAGREAGASRTRMPTSASCCPRGGSCSHRGWWWSWSMERPCPTWASA